LLFARYRDQAFRCRLRGFAQLLQGARLARSLKKMDPRPHLHAQFVDAASTVAYVAARLADATFSVTNHTAYNPYLPRPKLAHAARFFSISEFDRKHLLSLAGVPDAPGLRVVRQGVDLDRFPCRPPRFAGTPPEILTVAALREKKGHHVLLRAAGLLRDRGIRFRLTVVGEGPERGRLEALVRELDLAGHVRLAGAEPPERVRERLIAADLFVLACTTASNGDLDGVPISLMEAMATGVPVVSTRLSGIPELIQDAEEGILVAPDDPEGVAEAVAGLLADPERAAAMAARARSKIEAAYDLRANVARLAAELREVTG
jgi:glycosyltransferase involved in cell wall biosynthesis